jgi:hypothetical protein
MEELVQNFALTKDDGTPVTLHVYQDQVPVPTRPDPTATVPGIKRIVTAEGLTVNRRDKGEYEIVQTGEILRSSHPDAP